MQNAADDTYLTVQLRQVYLRSEQALNLSFSLPCVKTAFHTSRSPTVKPHEKQMQSKDMQRRKM